MAKHVLIPVDGSEQSEQALEHALDAFPDARFTLVHVVTPPSSYGYSSDEYFDAEQYEAAAKRQRERGEQLLETHRETAESRGVGVETVLATGKPSREILDAIDARDADHVVMGSRGRSGIGRVLFGSVAEAVTRRAPVPVTIVR